MCSSIVIAGYDIPFLGLILVDRMTPKAQPVQAVLTATLKMVTTLHQTKNEAIGAPHTRYFDTRTNHMSDDSVVPLTIRCFSVGQRKTRCRSVHPPRNCHNPWMVMISNSRSSTMHQYSCPSHLQYNRTHSVALLQVSFHAVCQSRRYCLIPGPP